MDSNGNMKADAKMWRFLVKDKQVILEHDKYQPIISSDFQNIIGNKRIEEICSSLDKITNYEERIERMKELLKEQKLSQLHFFLDLKKDQDTDIEFKFSEFHVILAAQTVASLSKTLEQINNIQNNLLPQLLVKKVEAAQDEPPPPPPPPTASKSQISATEMLGKETKLTFRGELSNIVFMLAKSGLKNKERVAKFSLTTKVEVDMVKKEKSSSLNVSARIEEICLDIIKNDTVLASLIEKTKIVFEMSDESEEETKIQIRKVKSYIDPIKVHLAFSHLGFFANTAAGIIDNLPSLNKAGQVKKTSHIQSIRQERLSVVKKVPQPYHVTTSVDAGIKLIEFIIFDDSEADHLKYPWIQLNITNTEANLKLEDLQGQQIMKGKAGIGTFIGKVAKKVDVKFGRYTRKFKKEHGENALPYMPVLEFGFENLSGSINKSENMELNVFLHRLYLKDVEVISKITETDSQIVPAIASDFQDIISNPLVEASKSNTRQLEVFINMNKQNEEIVVELTYSDFRVIISPPLIISLLDIMNLFNAQMAKITETLKVKGKQPEQELEVIKGEPGAIMPTRKLRFTGEIKNIEIWIPRSVETNQSRICQFSLTTKVNFSLVEKTEENRLLTRTMVASIKVYHLMFIMINKHLLSADDPISKASTEHIMLPSRISIDFKQHEDTDKDIQDRDVKVSIEPINTIIGFREIAFFRSLQSYYQTQLLDKLPQKEENKEEQYNSEFSEEALAIPRKLGYNKSTINVDIKMEPFNFILSDDTGIIEQHLFKLLISGLKAKVSMTTLLNEVKRDITCKDDDYLLCTGNFLLEALYYNSTVGEYEPVIENWGLNWEVLQHTINKGKEITVQADKMLNLNLSYAGVAMKKINELEENLIKEQEEAPDDIKTVDSISKANQQKEGFIFENKLGEKLTFHVQTMSSETAPEESYKEYILEAKKLLFLSRLELKQERKEKSKLKYGQSLKLISEDMLRIMVKLEGYQFISNVPIELGGCHSFIFIYKDIASKAKYKQYRYPAICRVNNTVTFSLINRGIIRLLHLNLM